MKSTPTRWAQKAGVLLASSALLTSLAACGGGSTDATDDPTDDISTSAPDGVDDGSTLTLWTRAPLEKQANLLVEAYNASHENQVELTVVPNDDYVAKVGAAAGSGSLPDLFAADIVYVPNWGPAGPVPGHQLQHQRPVLQGPDQPGTSRCGYRGRQGARAPLRARPLHAVLEQGALR